MADGMVLIGGLWKGTTKGGEAMLSGKVSETCKLIILPNKKKEPGDKRPDCNVFLASVDREQNSGGGEGLI